MPNPFQEELQRREAEQAQQQANPFAQEMEKRGLVAPSAEGLPELGTELGYLSADPSVPKQARPVLNELRAAVNVPRTIPGKINAIRQLVPDAGVDFAEDGTPVIDLGGKKYILNAPGLSGQDMREFVADLTFEAPLMAAGGGLGGALLGTPGRVLGVGAGGAGGVYARDTMARSVGSGEETDPKLMALVGGLAAGGEALAPVLTRFLRRVFSRGTLVKGAELTKEGRKVLKNAGINPDDVTPEFIADFRKLSKGDPAAAARVAEANDLARNLDTRPVPLTRGDATRDVRQQAMESAIERGSVIEGVPEEAAGALKDIRRQQQAALSETGDALQRRMGQGGMETTQSALAAERQALKGSVDKAYETARELRAGLGADTVSTISKNLNRAYYGQFNPGTSPVTNRILQQLQNFRAKFPGKVTNVTVRSMENWRQQLSRLRYSNNPEEAAAAGKMIKEFDSMMDDAVEQALVTGDVEAVNAFKQSRRLARQLKEQFSDDALVKRIVETDRGGKLKLPPSEAANVLFTASGAGGKKGAVNAVEKIGKILGRDSEGFRALKQEAFLRMLSAGTKGTNLDDQLARTFSGDRFAKAFEDAMQKSPELMSKLFSKEDLRLMAQLRRIALLATNRVPGAVNFSGTATIATILEKFGWLGSRARDMVNVAFKGLRKSNTNRLVETAIQNPVPPRRGMVLPGLGGSATTPGTAPLNNMLNK